MTGEEAVVWKYLRQAVGKEKAITRNQLCQFTGLPDRLIRQCVETLRKDHGKLICYSVVRPGGYFIAESVDDLRACRNIEAAREHHVRENRQFYDKALEAAGDEQLDLAI